MDALWVVSLRIGDSSLIHVLSGHARDWLQLHFSVSTRGPLTGPSMGKVAHHVLLQPATGSHEPDAAATNCHGSHTHGHSRPLLGKILRNSGIL
jgi:hypothetical protein